MPKKEEFTFAVVTSLLVAASLIAESAPLALPVHFSGRWSFYQSQVAPLPVQPVEPSCSGPVPMLSAVVVLNHHFWLLLSSIWNIIFIIGKVGMVFPKWTHSLRTIALHSATLNREWGGTSELLLERRSWSWPWVVFLCNRNTRMHSSELIQRHEKWPKVGTLNCFCFINERSIFHSEVGSRWNAETDMKEALSKHVKKNVCNIFVSKKVLPMGKGFKNLIH